MREYQNQPETIRPKKGHSKLITRALKPSLPFSELYLYYSGWFWYRIGTKQTVMLKRSKKYSEIEKNMSVWPRISDEKIIFLIGSDDFWTGAKQANHLSQCKTELSEA
ncbi:hypothetical protein RUM43_004440 [Polyplax serrata]|uniref:Uncharacterized protein n=1 Tax=Polyplax serrata TaxID=468196 RepID=A0AAN8XL57_POLSC